VENIFYLLPCGFFLSIVSINLLYKFIDGEINGEKFIIKTFALLTLVTLIFYTDGMLKPLLLALGVAIFIGPRFFEEKKRKNDMDETYKERIVEYEKILEEQPENWGTLSEMSHCYFKLKDYNKAIELQTEAVKRSNENLAERQKLNEYLLYVRQINTVYKFCWFCGAKLPENTNKCKKCGGTSNAYIDITNWLIKGGIKEIVGFMCLAMVAIVIFYYIVRVFSPDAVNIAFFWIGIVFLSCILKIVFRRNE